MPWDVIDNFGDVVEMDIQQGSLRPTPSERIYDDAHPERVSGPNFKKAQRSPNFPTKKLTGG
jgi:hypothetical protein